MATGSQLLVVLFACTLFYLVGSFCLGRTGRKTDDESNATPAPSGRTRTSAVSETDRSTVTSTPVTCRACRTENDPAYTYCRQCISELHGHHDRRA